MNPYEPPLANCSPRSPAKPLPENWLAFGIILILRIPYVAAFVFFPLLEILDVFVNWPNVVLLLVGATLVFTSTLVVRWKSIHTRFAARLLIFLPLLIGTSVGIVGAAFARLGWI